MLDLRSEQEHLRVIISFFFIFYRFVILFLRNLRKFKISRGFSRNLKDLVRNHKKMNNFSEMMREMKEQMKKK